jgi:hypothetical protein
MKLNRLAFWLWPPCEAKRTDKIIADRNEKMGGDARWDSMKGEIRCVLPKDTSTYKDLELIAGQIHDAESKRKETLESKASIFIAASGIATGVVSIIPALFADEWGIPIKFAMTAGGAYLLSIICFLVSAYYAVKVGKVAGFARPCADSFLNSMKSDEGSIEERIVLTIAQTKWNEDLLLRKSNYLSVAEDLFLRGLVLITFAALVSIVAKLFTQLNMKLL